MTLSENNRGTSRRGLFRTAAGLAALPIAARARSLPAPTVEGDAGLAEFVLNVNGRDHRVALDVRTTLLDALREHMDLVGSKKAVTTDSAGPAQSISMGNGFSPASSWPLPCRAGQSRQSKDSQRRTARCIRCNRPSSTTTDFSAATVPRARLCPPWRASTRDTPQPTQTSGNI